MLIDTSPKSTSDMVFTNAVSAKQIASILNGSYPFPFGGNTAILLYGTFGSGKTTYAEIFCRDFETSKGGDANDLAIEKINCDSTTRIGTVIRKCERIRSLQSFNKSGYHYFIFDEVDNLTDDAKRKLKLFLNYSNIVCILTTNYLHRVDDGLADRCIKINFNAANPTDYLPRIKHILRKQKLSIPSDQFLIDQIEQSDGSWRKFLPNIIFVAQMGGAPTLHRPPKSSPNLTIIK